MTIAPERPVVAIPEPISPTPDTHESWTQRIICSPSRGELLTREPVEWDTETILGIMLIELLGLLAITVVATLLLVV